MAFIRTEFFMAVKINVVFFWIMTPYSLVGGCHRFGGTYCLYLEGIREDEDSIYLWNVGNLLSEYTVTQKTTGNPYYGFYSYEFFCRHVSSWKVMHGLWLNYQSMSSLKVTDDYHLFILTKYNLISTWYTNRNLNLFYKWFVTQNNW
jgi:hypothetical protein